MEGGEAGGVADCVAVEEGGEDGFETCGVGCEFAGVDVVCSGEFGLGGIFFVLIFWV